MSVVFGVMLSSCDSTPAVDPEPFPVGATFELQSFATIWGSTTPPGGARIRITFFADNTFKGLTFTSERGHNTFWGSYQVDDDGLFAATPGGMTQVNEPEGSRISDFGRGLRHATMYSYHEGRLHVFYGAGILELAETVAPLPWEGEQRNGVK
jgi:hypothetical protein